MEIKGGAEQRLSIGPKRRPCSFKADPELWSNFKHTCKTRGVSICHVLEALMEAWIVGQKAEATVVKPVVVNLTMEHVVERPRRMIDAWQPKTLVWPPSCEYADEFIKNTKEVGCLRSKEFVALKECWHCFREKAY